MFALPTVLRWKKARSCRRVSQSIYRPFLKPRGEWASGQFSVSCFDSLHACWKVSCTEEFHTRLSCSDYLVIFKGPPPHAKLQV
jgi:hypothetical protein